MEDFAADLARFRTYLAQSGQTGDRLPPEAELADRFGVTRNRIRRLLKVAENEELLWRHVGKGTFLGTRSVASNLQLLPEQISPLETFEARLVIEPRLAGLAAARATGGEVDEMRDCIAQMKRADGYEVWQSLDAKLHRLVAKAARNTLLLALYDTIGECVSAGMKFRIRDVFSKRPTADTDEEHLAYVNAIGEHDPDLAERLMRSHIESVRRRLFGAL